MTTASLTSDEHGFELPAGGESITLNSWAGQLKTLLLLDTKP